MKKTITELDAELKDTLNAIDTDKDDLDSAIARINDANDELQARLYEFDERYEKIEPLFKEIKKVRNSIMKINEKCFEGRPTLKEPNLEYKEIKTDLPFITIKWMNYLHYNDPYYIIEVKHLQYLHTTEEDHIGADPTLYDVFPDHKIEKINEMYQTLARFYKGVE